MATTRFEKWQALGNDYLIVERDELAFELTPARVRRLCEGHFGVFADGVLLLSRPTNPEHVADLRIFNPDGSEAELSGNGAREAILYLRRRGWTDAGHLRDPDGGGRDPPDDHRPGDVHGGHGHGEPDARRTSPAGPRTAAARSAPTGASGASGTSRSATRSARSTSARLPSWRRWTCRRSAPRSKAPRIFPNRTNVSWYTELPDSATGEAGDQSRPGRIRARIFERGVGETLSSGTGATGAAVAHALERQPPLRPTRVTVLLDGGELEVQVGEDLHVDLTGWARPVFEGRLSEEFEKELHETE